MIKSASYLLVFALVVLFVGNGQLASAQNNACVQLVPVSWSCEPYCLVDAPPTTVCPEQCIVSCFCTAQTNACIPPNGEICVRCSLGKAADASAPINVATGNTYITQTDISVPGLGGGLSLTRTWNSILQPSQAGAPFMFGRNWRSTYEERMFAASDGYLRYTASEGSVWSFGAASGSGSTWTYRVAGSNRNATATNGSSNWTLTLENGEVRTYDNTTGRLLSISDRNGNTTQLAYDSSNRLTTVTDPASRHLYFNYAGSSTLVSSVTSDFGISLSYTYDGQGRLTQITKPDNTTISFQFDANSNITAVLDTNGKVLESHTYDPANRGLTGSRANGVEAVTVKYNQ